MRVAAEGGIAAAVDGDRRMIRIGKYRHYKGGIYYVIGLAEHTETCEEMVVYVPLDPTKPEKGRPLLQVRPLKSWDKPVEGRKEPRFEYLGEEA